VRTLRQLASDESLDEEARGAAIIALGRDEMSDEDVAWLRGLYPKLSPKLRDNVFLAVSRSDSPRASGWLAAVAADDSETEHTRQQAMFWLGQGRSPTDDLVRLYDRLSSSPSLRSHYTFVLSQRRDSQALDKLIDVAQHDPDKTVRHQALFWIGQSKDPRALAFIRDLVTR
jgi:HEAT repeat protein